MRDRHPAREEEASLLAPAPPPVAEPANPGSANASPENDQALLTTMGGSSDAKAVADLDRTVGFQARELRYPRRPRRERKITTTNG